MPGTSRGREQAGRFRAVWWRWAAVAAYMLAIFTESSRSSLPALPGQPSDKLLHFAAYAVLSALVIWAWTRGRWRLATGRTVLAAALFCALYGTTDEIHQRFVPDRNADPADVAADALGGLTAGAAVWAWGIIPRKRDRHDAV